MTPLLPTTMQRLSDGRHLRVARLGNGPPLVLLHGYPDNLQLWSRLAPLLADSFDVIAFDWPGLGYSDEGPGGATPQFLAERLLKLCDELSVPRATVVGFDMGGQPALALAAQSPQRVEQLVVMNSLVFGDAPTSWEIRWLRRLGFNRWALRWLPHVVFRRAEHTFLPLGEQLDAPLHDDFWQAFRQPEVRRFVSKMCAGYQGMLPRLPALYATIRCPTLVLWAERDKHFPLEQARRLQAAIPHARLAIVEHGTHWMPIDRAAEIAAILKAELTGARR